MNKKLLFILLFILVGSIALQIPFTQVVGSKANFTLFDFFAPFSGGFLGSGIGIISVFIIMFINLHPIGRTVWFYSIYWLIPLIVWPFRNNFLLARSLGATFTIHAVGGAI